MKVIFLGTGTSQGVPVIGCNCSTCTSVDVKDKRLRSSCVVVIGNTHILIDTTPDLRSQMLFNKISRIDAILYTHEHNDHTAGLDDVRPFNFMHQMHIPVYLENRMVNDIKTRFSYIFSDNPYPGAPRIILNEINDFDTFFVNEIPIIPIRVLHGSLPILGYRFGDFAYLTDVKSIPPSSFAQLKGVRFLVLNALRYNEHYSHVTVSEAIAISQTIGAVTTYLTHMSHQIEPHELFSEKLPINVKPAYDGLVWELA